MQDSLFVSLHSSLPLSLSVSAGLPLRLCKPPAQYPLHSTLSHCLLHALPSFPPLCLSIRTVARLPPLLLLPSSAPCSKDTFFPSPGLSFASCWQCFVPSPSSPSSCFKLMMRPPMSHIDLQRRFKESRTQKKECNVRYSNIVSTHIVISTPSFFGHQKGEERREF